MADSKEPKKETVRITLPPRPGAPASGEGAPTARETVRINLPARPPAAPARPGPIQPPPGLGAAPPRPPTAHAPLPPAPSKPVAPPPFFPGKTPPASPAASTSASPAMPRPAPPPPPASSGREFGLASSAGPKKETARITVLPDPSPKPATPVQMKKTQPLSTMPQPTAPMTSVNIAPNIPVEQQIETGISMALCWSLLAISAVVLILQIWNYFG
jgi:hypothetical protein